MITIRKNGFYQVENHAHVPCIGIETDRLATCVSGIRELKAKGVFCSPYHRFSSDNMSFLKELQDMEAVLMRDTTLLDIDELYNLSQLKYFRCNSRRPPIDFSRLTRLEKLVLEPVGRDSAHESLLNLKALHLWNYRPISRDFKQFPLPDSITELELNWVSFNSLADLPELPKLERLIINHCKNLIDLNLDLRRYPKLEYFKTKACIKIPADKVEQARVLYADKIAEISLEEQEEEHPH